MVPREREKGRDNGQALLVLGHGVLGNSLVPYSMYINIIFFFLSPLNFLLIFFPVFFIKEFFKMPLSSRNGNQYPLLLCH